MIQRHRARMMPGGVGYSDTPTFGGFGPKSPCSEHAMELGDLEAAFVGNLARYCMVMGTLPPFSLRGLWWVNGECKGLGVVDWDTDVEPIIPLIHHMQHYAPFIVGTEGVDELMENGIHTRAWSNALLIQESDKWLTLEEACEFTGRKPETIRQWKDRKFVETLDDRWGVMYSRSGLEMVVIAMEKNARESRFRKIAGDDGSTNQ